MPLSAALIADFSVTRTITKEFVSLQEYPPLRGILLVICSIVRYCLLHCDILFYTQLNVDFVI